MLIGLHGAAGSGKDTLANSFSGWTIYRMAGPLKAGLSAMLNIPLKDIENPLLKNKPDYKFGRSIRYLAQTLGTEWGRTLVADDVWIQMAKENISSLSSYNNNVVITDIRFENEAKAVREMGGKIIHIIRSNNPHTAMVVSGGVIAHASEIVLDDSLIDVKIINNGSIQDLLFLGQEALMHLVCDGIV